MRKVIALFLFLISGLLYIAKGQTSLSGTVHDANQNPIQFAEVYLLKQDSVYNFIFTDEEGKFALNAPKNNYILQILKDGVEVHYEEINLNNNLDLGKLIINSPIELSAAVIEGRKNLIERKVDRLVFNVENSVSATGGDALDALKIIPGVKVQNENITLAGKSSIKIMIDDRVVQLSESELINYLKSISSDDIKKIEVITTPPAKYEAEGNSGLINIQLKEAEKNAWATTLRTSYRQATYSTLDHGVNFSYQKDKLALMADLSYRYGNTLYTNNIFYDYPNEDWFQYLKNKNKQNGLGTLVNIQYDINDKNSLGLQYSGNFSEMDGIEANESKSYQDRNLIKNHPTNGETNSNSKYNTVNLNYNHKLDTLGKKFSVDFDYVNSNLPRDNHFISNLYDYKEDTHDVIYALNNSKQKIYNYSGRIDFTIPNKWGTLEFGAKASFTETKNSIDTKFYNQIEPPTLELDYLNLFNYKENVQAIYMSYSKEFGDKWEVKLGLRGEYTQTKSNSKTIDQLEKNDYFKLFPSLYIQYQPSKIHSFNFNLSRRIQRPEFWRMNPNRRYSSSKSYTEGNPFLQPAFVYNFELNYSFKNLIHLNTSFSKTKDGFGQVTFHDVSKDEVVFKRLNYYDLTRLEFSVSSSFNLFKWWETNNTIFGLYSKSKNYLDIMDDSYSGWYGYLESNNSLTLNANKTFLANFIYGYTFKSKSQEFNISNSSYLNIGFKYLFFDKKLVVGLNFYDIFKDNITTLSTTDQNIYQSFRQYYDTRQIRISVSYKFGNDKIAVNKRNVGNQEEADRIN